LTATFLTYGFVEFEQIKLLASNLWDFYLGDAFRAPILSEMFFEFALFLKFAKAHFLFKKIIKIEYLLI